MKNKVFVFTLMLCAAALFSSCLNLMDAALTGYETYKITLDEENPEEQSATITFKASFIMKRWNGSDISELMYGKRKIYANDNIVLTVPEGNNRFIFDMYYIFDSAFSYTSYRNPNAELSYSFEAGKKYQIKSRAKSRGKGYDFFYGLYDITNKSTLIKEWQIGED